MSKKIDRLVKKADLFEKLALNIDRIGLLKAIAQGYNPQGYYINQLTYPGTREEQARRSRGPQIPAVDPYVGGYCPGLPNLPPDMVSSQGPALPPKPVATTAPKPPTASTATYNPDIHTFQMALAESPKFKTLNCPVDGKWGPLTALALDYVRKELAVPNTVSDEQLIKRIIEQPRQLYREDIE